MSDTKWLHYKDITESHRSEIREISDNNSEGHKRSNNPEDHTKDNNPEGEISYGNLEGHKINNNPEGHRRSTILKAIEENSILHHILNIIFR